MGIDSEKADIWNVIVWNVVIEFRILSSPVYSKPGYYPGMKDKYIYEAIHTCTPTLGLIGPSLCIHGLKISVFAYNNETII